MSKAKSNIAKLAWLERVLHERFDIEVQLHPHTRTSTQLTINNDPGYIIIDASAFPLGSESSQLPCSEWNPQSEGWRTLLFPSLPAPGTYTLPSPLIEKSQTCYHIHYDILGLTWWALSRAEEVGRKELDQHNRFSSTASHAFRHDYLERPIVDEWLDILAQVIQRQWPNIVLKQHKFNVKVSHDVDSPSRYGFTSPNHLAKRIAEDLIVRKNLHAPIMAPFIWLTSKQVLHAKDPANTFDWLMDLSEQHGLKSAFYFMCGQTDRVRDAAYKLEHTSIRNLIWRIHSRGHEIGLHPSYQTYQNPGSIAAEAKNLRNFCQNEGIVQSQWGGRMHFLRWDHPSTLHGWALAGMDYDCSLGYADRPGFRCGTCFEYPAIDPLNNEILQLRIRPLIAMECSIISNRYLGLGTGDAAYEKFGYLKETCKAVNGCFSLLWHNSELYNVHLKNLYRLVLAA